MAGHAQTAKSRTMAPLRLDPAATIRRSLEVSPGRSHVHSSRAHTLSSSVATTPVVSTRPASPGKTPLHPDDSNAFLRGLATQERRVLELKEELQKAEAELDKLKKQWATHEATKKRNELCHVQQLQPLRISGSGLATSRDAQSNTMASNPDRQKMARPMAKPSRTVFPGSRHTRALSLLSPKDSTLHGLHLPSPSHGPSERHRFAVNDEAIPDTIHESINSTDGIYDSDRLHRGPPKDVILETGKQLVGDFRHGLWTFFEDLRQVTVGDEAASATDTRNQNAMVAGHMPKTQIKNGRLLGGGRHIAGRAKTLPADSTCSRQKIFKSSRAEQVGNVVPDPPAGYNYVCNANSNSSDSDDDGDDDGWDNWDTVSTKGSAPRCKTALFATDVLVSPLTDKSSPTTSTSSTDATRLEKRVNTTKVPEDTPWPALTRLAPGGLTKTASTIMIEWEKTLYAT